MNYLQFEAVLFVKSSEMAFSSLPSMIQTAGATGNCRTKNSDGKVKITLYEMGTSNYNIDINYITFKRGDLYGEQGY